MFLQVGIYLREVISLNMCNTEPECLNIFCYTLFQMFSPVRLMFIDLVCIKHVIKENIKRSFWIKSKINIIKRLNVIKGHAWP